MAEEQDTFGVLYLDDSDVQLREVEHVLQGAGFQVRVAQNVNEARRRLAGVDLVIVDFHMPDMEGPEAMHVLRATPGCGAHTLFYLYTTDTAVASNFRAYGFDGAFTAKGDSRTLLSQLETARRVLRMRRFMRDRKA